MKELYMTTHNAKTVGTPVNRVDGSAKVSGQARYAAEHMSDRTPLIGWVVSSDTAVGKITSLNTEQAEQAEGVHAVITYKNAGTLKPFSKPAMKAGLLKVAPYLTNLTFVISVRRSL